MRLLIIGGTKGIGRQAALQARDAGHEVRVLARSPDALDGETGLEAVQGDATEADSLRPALAGMDAVISTLGLGGATGRFFEETRLFSSATAALLPLLGEIGPRRLLAVTGFGAGDSIKAMSWPERTGHRAILGRAYADKDRQEEMIRASDLDWTIVRPVILTEGPHTGRYKVLREPAKWRNGLISRADVADYLVRAVSEGLDVQAAVVLAR
jgi:uncharacterized protein YbjT (DUF2867 family)